MIPTSAGLLVRGAGGARLYRARELTDAYADQRGCVVSDDEIHVACLRGDRAWVGAWAAP